MIIHPDEIAIFELALGTRKDSAEASLSYIHDNPDEIEALDEQQKRNVVFNQNQERETIEIIDNILARIKTDDNLELQDEKEIKQAISCIQTYRLIIETEVLELLKEDELTDQEIEEYKMSMKIATNILGRAKIKNYKDVMDKFIQEIELLTDPEEISFTLKKTELQAILDVLHHVEDHEKWMYEVFNGSALKSGHSKLSYAMEKE